MAWLPSPNGVAEIHFVLAKIFESENDPISPVGIKSKEMLESACERPNTGMGGTFKYNAIEEKCAALFHSLTKNHPFHNGNKRTALVSLLTTLYRNDKIIKRVVTDDDIYDFVVAVTADEYPAKNHGLTTDGVVEAVARWIKKNSTPIKAHPAGMKTRDFIDKCIAAGGHCKNSSDGAYVVSYKRASIRVSKSTRQLNGNVVRQFLNKLGLNEHDSGISMEEFQEGVNDERAQIYRYMTALRRLAKT
ncbi:type II toxin-antitoxin system death-on-curing family toxin [Chromobacterium vaccinii]|uniref:type II toxin-antitoxin system death-on-curing family toxin n=1 Tax=Chromobacterium vaccinii TaxID=1108595 RepID=UPI0034591282